MALGWVVLLVFAGFGGALGSTQAWNVSERCTEDTDTFLRELNQERPKEYAVLMYDAFGKIGSDVEGGNVNRLGLREECRSAHGPTFSGQYCQVFIRQGTVNYFVGVCVPDSCAEEDVEILALYGRLKFGQTSLIPPLPPILVNQSTQEMLMTHCLPNTIHPDASGIICLVVCCVMVAVPLAATLFTAIIKWHQNREGSPTAESSCSKTDLNHYETLKTNGTTSRDNNSNTAEENSNHDTKDTPQCFSRSCVYGCLQAFSLQTTSQGVFSSSSSISGGGYSSLNGIRVLSLLWIICGHASMFVGGDMDNHTTFMKTIEGNPLYVFSLTGPVFLAVDSFLLLGGLLSAKSLLGSIKRAEDKLSPSLVANYLFKRIKRVHPSHMFLICLSMALLSLVQWGPYWFVLYVALSNCKKHWWTNVLFINNLFPFEDMCIPWTWYLSLDFQCYLTTPLLVLLYRLNRAVFGVVVGVLLLLTTLADALITALMQLPVSLPDFVFSQSSATSYYEKPYTRYGPFLIGFLIGIYLTTKKDPLLKQKWQAALGWFCCLALMLAIVGLAYLLKGTPTYPSAGYAIYQALHRSLWALTVTWIILACEDGYGGFINSFLSSGFWRPISNISFACYLTHPLLIIIYAGVQETPIHYTALNYMYQYFGHVLFTLGVSYALTVLIEKPYILLKCSSK